MDKKGHIYGAGYSFVKENTFLRFFITLTTLQLITQSLDLRGLDPEKSYVKGLSLKFQRMNAASLYTCIYAKLKFESLNAQNSHVAY